MPRKCNYCSQVGHYESKCFPLKIDRVLSIVNNRVDLPPYNEQGEWFKDHNGNYPLQLGWTPPFEHIHITIPRAFYKILSLLDYFQNLKRFPTRVGGMFYRKNKIWFHYFIRRQPSLDHSQRVILNEQYADPQNRNNQNGVYGTFKKIQCDVHKAIIEAKQEQQEIIERTTRREQNQKKYIESIKALPLSSKPIDTDECSICFETIGPTNKSILRCGHMYCGDCIFHHFQRTGGTFCPNCRQEFAIRLPGWVAPFVSWDDF